jgi:bifunctional non-homologous end joining protein LigD
MKVKPHEIEISHADKLLFPDAGISKADLAEYYLRIAETMLPYLEERPISMQRFPDGIHEQGFYHKEVPDYFPDWIETAQVEVKEEDGTQRQVVVNQAATLVFLADQACITPHAWLSRADKLDYPDRLIFDLDPPNDDFAEVRFAAKVLNEILREVGLVPYVMTTGSKGAHVVVPLDRQENFDAVRAFGSNLCDVLASRYPDRLTTKTRKDQRKGRLFLDYLRNAYAQTAVPPYAVRPLPGAPVVAPLDWDELDDPELNSQSYSVKNIFRRLGQKDDPWKGMQRHARSLSNPRQELERLVSAG